MAVYYNWNETFIPVYTIDQRLATYGSKFPNRFVAMNEGGLKFDLFDGRVVATASYYRTVEDNVLMSEIDVDGSVTGTTGRSYSAPVGSVTTRGWDLDASVNVRKGLDLIVSCGKTHARLETGRRTSSQPCATAAVLARYEVQSGVLKGASVLWNYTWWGDSSLNSRTYWTVPQGDLHTLILGYRWRKYVFRLRIENVFDDIKLRPSATETATGVTNHRNYRLSMDYVW
jgi:outer membrane receptor for ferric coprogen and ferric-rhodotorulic acid